MAFVSGRRSAPATTARRSPQSRLATAFIFAALALAATLIVTGCADDPLPTGTGAVVPSAAPTLASQDAQPIPGQWIVTFRDDVSDVPGLARQLAAQHGGELKFTYTAALKGFAASLPDAAVEALQRNPNVALVEQDAVVTATDVQSSAKWGLDRIDQRALPLDGQYGYANSGAGVSVYILDTGIRSTHYEFGGRVRAGFTAFNDGYGTEDCRGHGTHSAGIVGGSTFGVAKQVTMYSVRVLDCSGSGTYSSIIAGVDWVTKNRTLPAVANMSLRGTASSTLNTAVQNSINAGVVYAVAAGNDTADACAYSPASLPAALTVAASTSADVQASFSNYGKCVDLYAPGQGIFSSYNTSDSMVVSASGTSAAAPFVAGVAALYLASHPTATPQQVTDALLSSASGGVIGGAGAGTPNLLLYSPQSASAPVPPPDTSTAPLPPPTEPAPPQPAPTDQPPTASFTSSCPKGVCTFDAGASSDDKQIVSYAWTFGDGSTAFTTTSRMTHAYTARGSFTVSLTVKDGAGQSATRTATISIKKVG
jgi:aqualysin 1